MIDNSKKYDGITIKESDVILFIMDYLKNKHLDKTLISLEQETALSLYHYNKELTFLRKLIIDGQWKEVEEFLQPLSQNPNFNFKSALYEIRKQKFLEEVETEPENNNEVDNLVKQLKEIQKLCSANEFNKLLQCLSTTPSITDQEEYKNWNSISGRLNCFEKVRKLLEIIYPITDNEYNNENNQLQKVIESIFYLSNGGDHSIIDEHNTILLNQMLKSFIGDVTKDVNENKLNVNFVYEHNYGKKPNSENNLLKSTRNEMIISQSIQANKIEEMEKKENSQNNNTIVTNTNQYNTTIVQNNDISNITESKQISYDDFIVNDNYYVKYTKSIDLSSLSLSTQITDSNIIRTCCYSPKGDYVAIGTNSKSIKIFGLKDSLNDFINHRTIGNKNIPLVFEQKNHHDGSIYCINWSVSGRLLASGSNDKKVKLMVIPELDTTLSDDDILELPISGHQGTVRSVIFDPASDLILFSAGIIDHSVKIWDTENGESRGELLGHTGDIHSLAWSNDGNLFASGGADRKVRFWDLNSNLTSAIIDAKEYDSICDISIINSGSTAKVALGHADGKVTIWDYYSKTLIKEIKNCLLGQEVRSIDFSPDGKYLMAGGFDSKIRIYNSENGYNIVGRLEHNDKVVSARFHPYVPFAMSTSSDKTARLWIPDKY